VREENGQDGADSEKVLDLECIEIWVMSWFVVIQHEVDDIARGSDEEEFECSQVKRVCEGPEEI